MRRATAECPLVVVIDGVDGLSEEHDGRKMTWLPRDLPEHVKVIVSTLPEERHECLPALKKVRLMCCCCWSTFKDRVVRGGCGWWKELYLTLHCRHQNLGSALRRVSAKPFYPPNRDSNPQSHDTDSSVLNSHSVIELFIIILVSVVKRFKPCSRLSFVWVSPSSWTSNKAKRKLCTSGGWFEFHWSGLGCSV